MTLALAIFLASGAPAAAVPPVELELVASVSSPLYVTHAGDARLFIVQRDGQILVHDGSQVLATPFLDLSALVDDVASGGGLFSLAFHPDYGVSSDYFFVSYYANGADSVVARYAVSANPDVADAGSGVELLRFSEPNDVHNVGQLAFGPDGFLYVGAGDGGGQDGPDCRAQHGDNFHGKLLRLDVDQNVATPPYYGIPASNPFAAPADGILDEIWAKGFRNPWRFSFERLRGHLWIGDVGQSTREEVIRQRVTSGGGQNYGWKVMEGTSCHDPDPVDASCPVGTPSCGDPAYTGPTFEYATGSDCAVVGGYVYWGSAIPGLVGHYVFGDVCSKKIWALEGLPGSYSRSEIADASFDTTFYGFTSFGEDVAGELYLTLGDDVYRLTPEKVPSAGPPALALLCLALLAGAALRRRRRGAAGSPKIAR